MKGRCLKNGDNLPKQNMHLSPIQVIRFILSTYWKSVFLTEYCNFHCNGTNKGLSAQFGNPRHTATPCCPRGSLDSLDPHEGVVELRVYWLQVFEGQRLVQDALVKWEWEASVDKLSVEKSLKGQKHTQGPLTGCTAQSMPANLPFCHNTGHKKERV